MMLKIKGQTTKTERTSQ